MKKSKPATAVIVPYTPQDQAAELKRMVDRMVEEKLAAATTGGDAVFQPFFQPYEISNAISRTQTVTEQQKWTYYFEKWGCLVCQCKDNRYGGLGMIRDHSSVPDQPQPTFMDSVKLARAALVPSIEILAESARKK